MCLKACRLSTEAASEFKARNYPLETLRMKYLSKFATLTLQTQELRMKREEKATCDEKERKIRQTSIVATSSLQHLDEIFKPREENAQRSDRLKIENFPPPSFKKSDRFLRLTMYVLKISFPSSEPLSPRRGRHPRFVEVGRKLSPDCGHSFKPNAPGIQRG